MVHLSVLSKREIEDHHIYPLAMDKTLEVTAKELRKSDSPLNSILNRTYITKEANRKIGALDYENYVKNIKCSILEEHAIRFPDEYNIEKFISDRYQVLKNIIIKEIKTLVRDNVYEG